MDGTDASRERFAAHRPDRAQLTALSKGVVERLQGFVETNFERGRSFANELDFQLQLDDWFAGRANVRTHRALRRRPVDRLPRTWRR